MFAEHRQGIAQRPVFCGHAVLKPGRYAYHNTLAKLDSDDVGDVFRDETTGETPEHVTFDVSAEHIALVRSFTVIWDAARDVPAIDPARPYGTASTPPALHHEMQPALQIFLRYADLGPGMFRRDASGWVAA